MTIQTNKGSIRIGVGGWNFPPWRGTFYPARQPQTRELEYASRHVTSIEINSTFYGAQKRPSFIKWFSETPDDFVFAVKAARYVTHRRALADAGKTIESFLQSGVTELKHKLGPINWQLQPTKEFDARDVEAFLKLLPKRVEGVTLKHALEVRHPSFRSADFLALAREYAVAVVVAGDSEYPRIDTLTGPFVYARVMGTTEGEPHGYSAKGLAAWARQVRSWAAERDVYFYFISGNKVANPAAAMGLIKQLA